MRHMLRSLTIIKSNSQKISLMYPIKDIPMVEKGMEGKVHHRPYQMDKAHWAKREQSVYSTRPGPLLL